MEKVLLIVASGKSSRYGGFPKAFCKIGNKTNVQNTIDIAFNVFDRIYLAVNVETYQLYRTKVYSCEMFDIITGQGDAHSLLKCLKHIQEEQDFGQICVCWGDAVFLDQSPFLELLKAMDRMDKHVPGIVACSNDENPYAWFDVVGTHIMRAHFAREEGGSCLYGLHDQSLFGFNVQVIIKYLEQYKNHMGIIEDNMFVSIGESAEMKLLNSFGYFYENELLPMQFIEIPAGKVYSFNTKEELEKIKKYIFNSGQ